MLGDWSEGIAVVELSDDPQLSDDLQSVIDRIAGAETSEVPHVVLNMGLVSYMTSSNISQLIQVRKALMDAGRALKLCSIDDRVRSVLQISGLDKLFDTAPDPMTALAGLQLDDTADA